MVRDVEERSERRQPDQLRLEQLDPVLGCLRRQGFTVALAADKTIGSLADQISGFVAENKVAAKSIGVEYLESAKKLIISSRPTGPVRPWMSARASGA